MTKITLESLNKYAKERQKFHLAKPPKAPKISVTVSAKANKK